MKQKPLLVLLLFLLTLGQLVAQRKHEVAHRVYLIGNTATNSYDRADFAQFQKTLKQQMEQDKQKL